MAAPGCTQTGCGNKTRDESGKCHWHRSSAGTQSASQALTTVTPSDTGQPPIPRYDNLQAARIDGLLSDETVFPVIAQACRIPIREVREILTEAGERYSADSASDWTEEDWYVDDLYQVAQNGDVAEALAYHYGSDPEQVQGTMLLLHSITTDPEEHTKAAFARDYVAYMRYAEQVEELAVKMEEIKDKFRDLDVVDGAKTNYELLDGGGVSLTPKRKFSAALAEKTLSKKELKAITVEKLDPSLASKVLPEDTYEACREDSTTAVSFF